MATLQASASRPKIIGFTCTDEELFNSFDNLTGGSPLPSNVFEVNPYRHEPEHLPEDVWFLISSNENTDMEHGIWKTIEEAHEVFSNSEIIGWRTTLQYYKGKAPHVHNTEWVMQVFSITQKRVCDDNDKKETRSLCRVFLVSGHEMQQRVSNTGIENETGNNLTHPPVLDANSSTRIGSSRNPEVNVVETEVLAATQRLPVPVPVPEHQGDNPVEMDWCSISRGDFLELQDLENPVPEHQGDNPVGMDWYSISRGDFLELQDLENPASTSSSDECFDPMAFLQDLEHPILEQNDAGRRLNVSATNKSDEVVIIPPTLAGSLVSVEGNNSGSNEFFRTTGSVPGSGSASRNLSNKVTEHAQGNQRAEGPSSSSSRKPSASSDSHTAADGRKRAAFDGMRKLIKKYMPF